MASFFLSRSQDGALTDGELEEDEPNFESLNEMESGQREEEEAGESFDDERPLRTVYPLALALSLALLLTSSLSTFSSPTLSSFVHYFGSFSVHTHLTTRTLITNAGRGITPGNRPPISTTARTRSKNGETWL